MFSFVFSFISLEPTFVLPTLPFIFPTLPTKTFVSVSTSPTPPFDHPSQSCQTENDVFVAENWEKRVNDDVRVISDSDTNQNNENIGHFSENPS